MSEPAEIGDLELAALISSRICHDVISPVGAIANGLEMLGEEQDEAMREQTLALIRKSAHQASAKLQFARLAFGAAGSAGAEIDLLHRQLYALFGKKDARAARIGCTAAVIKLHVSLCSCCCSAQSIINHHAADGTTSACVRRLTAVPRGPNGVEAHALS